MPPQVRIAGEGTRPVAPQTTDGVEQTKSSELEKKPAEQKKDSTENKSAEPYRATPKEASQKKAEMATTSTTQQIKLNQQLKEKENKTEKAASQVKPEPPKTKTKESQGGWEFVKGAARYAADAGNAGARMVGESAALVGAAHIAEKERMTARAIQVQEHSKKANELAAEVERVGSGKANFVDAERVIGKLDSIGSIAATDIYHKDKSLQKLLGPYGYSEVTDLGPGYWDRGAITKDEVLETALHNWRNTPLGVRKNIHDGNNLALVGTDYKKNWRPIPNIEGQNRAESGRQIVMDPPVPGDHGRVYVGPKANRPDPDLVWANAKKEFTQASFDVINSLGVGSPAKAGSPSTVVNPKRSSTTGRPHLIDTSRSAPPPSKGNVAETQPGPTKSSSNVPQTTNSIPTQQQSQPGNTGQKQSVPKNNTVNQKKELHETKNADQSKPTKASKTIRPPGSTAEEADPVLRGLNDRLKKIKDIAGDHAAGGEGKGLGRDEHISILKKRLEDRAKQGDQVAAGLLREIEDVQKRQLERSRELGLIPKEKD